MSDTLKRILVLQKEMERQKELKARAEGALKQMMDTLRIEHKCESIEEGKKMEAKLTKLLANDEAALEEMVSKIERSHGELLRKS